MGAMQGGAGSGSLAHCPGHTHSIHGPREGQRSGSGAWGSHTGHRPRSTLTLGLLSPALHLLACVALVASASALTLQQGYGGPGGIPVPVAPGIAPVQGADDSANETALPVVPRGNTGGGGPLGMIYYGGPVLHNPIKVYIFWLGAFSQAQKRLVRQFLASLNPSGYRTETVSHWWNISTQYYDGQGRHVSPRVTIAGEHSASTVTQLQYNATKDLGTLSGSQTVSRVISDALTTGVWPTDPDAVYVLFTAANIMQIGTAANGAQRFCKDYCGWHSSFRATPEGANKTSVKYLWVGLPTRLCPGQCITKLYTSHAFVAPNRDPGMHAAISTLAHELAESATNPTGKAWITAKGKENADICSWRFGKIQTVNNTKGPPTGFNLRGVEGSKFLVQMNWDITTGACSQGSKGTPVRPADTTPKSPRTPANPHPPWKRPRRTWHRPKRAPPRKPPPPLRAPPHSGCWCFLPHRRTCPESCTASTASYGPPGATYACYKTRRQKWQQFQCCIPSPACSKFKLMAPAPPARSLLS